MRVTTSYLSTSIGALAREADQTSKLQACLEQLRAGDETAREKLIEAAAARLRILTHDMLVGDRLRLWEETDDVLQVALSQLYKSLADVRPLKVRDFLRLAAMHIRRATITMARGYFGPHGLAGQCVAPGQHESDVNTGPNAHLAVDSTPSKIAERTEQWLRVHQAVEKLPADLREVTELLWLHGLPQVEVARLLHISDRTVRRRWQRARLRLADAMDETAVSKGSYRHGGLDAG